MLVITDGNLEEKTGKFSVRFLPLNDPAPVLHNVSRLPEEKEDRDNRQAPYKTTRGKTRGKKPLAHQQVIRADGCCAGEAISRTIMRSTTVEPGNTAGRANIFPVYRGKPLMKNHCQVH